MLIYLYTVIFLIALIILYFRIASYFKILDRPNQRSSHSYNVIRGGGIVFPAAALIWSVMTGYSQAWIISALLILAVVSFLDDLQEVSSKRKVIIHFIVVSILFWQLGIFENSIFVILTAYILTIGGLNAFNFMDGINAITPFYSMVTLLTFFGLNQKFNFTSEELIIVLMVSVVIFSWFNVRKQAKTFAGDVGSISLAFLFVWLTISLILETGRFEYIMLFAVYGIDSSITIVIRLLRHENIFQAHRKHLYQYLANELGWSQILVSALYATIQLLINLLVIWLLSNEKISVLVFVALLIMLSALYLIIRMLVHKQISRIQNKTV
jgi:UDP-GlcNAc:undecaprenyl-phosphate GlcNAc-1-phosphate transferase